MFKNQKFLCFGIEDGENPKSYIYVIKDISLEETDISVALEGIGDILSSIEVQT